ncbi:hypothetical protein ILUMI_08183 [Ignelater luminosus]|uniref:Uncharacterized protein n=1 Tax=Ignelater luminosus TaxID=2038154 RepID=A0A8K0GG61_IGNLU|nr:hypothetical protein ILUMI_08183 [Ignelater luminosus]
MNRPFAVGFYNKNMGEVDLLDQLLALYSPTRRNRRWYISVYAFSRCSCKFKASVGRALINIGIDNENRRGRPKSVTPPGILKKRKPNHHVPDEIRKDQKYEEDKTKRVEKVDIYGYVKREHELRSLFLSKPKFRQAHLLGT